MSDRPSPQLSELLTRFGLGERETVRCCRRHIRAVGRKIPIFDTIWVDALVAQSKLTFYQADKIAAGQSEELFFSDYVLTEPIRPGSDPRTFLAKDETGNIVVLTMITELSGPGSGLLDRLSRLCDLSTPGIHQSIRLPHQVVTHGEKVGLVSEPVTGPSVAELILRRGRLETAFVIDAARQLASAFDASIRSGVVHGAIYTTNIRVEDSGRVIAVGGGIAPITAPVIRSETFDSPESCDGIAPERIGGSAPPTETSDIYAFGCLIWAMSAGRAPFLQGDPLARLTAHRTGRVPDLRDYCGDAAEPIADLVARCTEPDPGKRPESFVEISASLGKRNQRVKSGLRLLAPTPSTSTASLDVSSDSFNQTRPRYPLRKQATLCGAIALAAVLLGFGPTFFFQLMTPKNVVAVTEHELDSSRNLTNAAAATEDALSSPEVSRQDELATAGESLTNNGPTNLRKMPPPDEAGVIRLSSSGYYEASTIDYRGDLKIIGPPQATATIKIVEQPLRVRARTVTLERVGLSASAGATSPALILANAQSLFVRDSSFDGGDGRRTIGLGWRRLDSRDRSGGVVRLSDCRYRGLSTGLFLSEMPNGLSAQNCLVYSSRSFVTVNKTAGADSLRVLFRRVTSREVDRVIDVRFDSEGFSQLNLHAEKCAFSGDDGAAVFGWIRAEEASRFAIEIDGRENLIDPPVSISRRLKDSSRLSPSSEPRVKVAGVVAGQIKFAGKVGANPDGSRVVDFVGPRRGDLDVGYRPVEPN
ncbi:serine/threonine protein kinase [Stratiformator vulcanicus]|uniref:Serine/threonine-protein kinase PrkC n=1 Tax=Stratiformator vulcanicus TaxID=2527980 RepID=A0A517R2H7_9PLAN|nr:protein kinase [Stratiformator vulcanicus]QDT38053.1 Serine/threonine-protein kinase PrkC [Stratiformator vulcanicus]